MRIEGFFDTYGKATLAVQKLKSEGFKQAYTDLNDHYNHEMNVDTNNPGTDSSSNSLTETVIKSGNPIDVDLDQRPLMAASPMVSGMGGFEEIADYNNVVVVETDETQSAQAKQIIESMGGQLKNPNYNAPKHLENIEYDDIVSQKYFE